MSGVACEMKCAECCRTMCTGARELSKREEVIGNRSETGKSGRKVRIRHAGTGRYLSVLESGLLWLTPHADEADAFDPMVGAAIADAVNAVAEAFQRFAKIAPAVTEPAGEAPHGATTNGGEA